MEIEAKYSITAALDPARIESLELKPYTLVPARVEEHTDMLLDTRDRRITTGKRALRVRAIGDTLTLTLKGPNTGSGGVHVRQEWEAPLPAPLNLDPSTWPAPIGPEVVDLIANEPLITLLRDVVQRQTWVVKRGARVIGELALDAGAILAAGRSERIFELELELKGAGARADLDALDKRLVAELPLQPETRSKAQRGLALLLHAKWSLDGYTPLVSLATHYIRLKRRAAESAMTDVARDGSPDAIHDMRVAIRRMRSALLEIERVEVFDRRAARRLRHRLRKIASRLGAVRDLDIIIERLTSSGAASERDGNVADTIARLRFRRNDAYARVQHTLSSDRFRHTLERLRRCDIAREDASGAWDCAPVRDFAGGILWSGFDALARHDRAIQLGDIVEMHRARIAAKRLRYTLELLAPSMPDAVTPLRQALIAFQESFGSLHDIAITLSAVEATASDGKTAFTDTLRHELETHRASALFEARATWSQLTSPAVRESLAAALASM